MELANGWKKELNFIIWNNKEDMHDIREWDLEHRKMEKGVTLSREEWRKFREILEEIEL